MLSTARSTGLAEVTINAAGVEGSTRELSLLEPGADGASNQHQLKAAPIPSGWILEGRPAARNKFLSGSSDDMSSTFMWDCTAGRFNWFYDIDETICLLEGSVVLKFPDGEVRHVKAGDTVFFACGTRAEWTVERYVRKIAFIHVPMTRKMRLVQRCLTAIASVMRFGTRQGATQPFKAS